MRGERPHSSPGQPQGSRHHPSAAPALTMTPCRLRGRAVVIVGEGDPCGRPGGGTYALASLENVSGREGWRETRSGAIQPVPTPPQGGASTPSPPHLPLPLLLVSSLFLIDQGVNMTEHAMERTVR